MVMWDVEKVQDAHLETHVSRVQLLSFLRELDLNASFSEDCAHSLLNCLNMLKYKTVAPLKYFQRLLGNMASSAVVMHKIGMEL